MTKFGNKAQKLNNLRPAIKNIIKILPASKKGWPPCHPALNGRTSLPCIISDFDSSYCVYP